MSTALSSSDDEFSAYNFSEFTEEDLRRVDADMARMYGGPQITIQIETPQASSDTIICMSQTPHASGSHSKGKQRADVDPLSPMAKYRKRGVLSVTDLASLAWCEVQFDYGLRQRRHEPIASRPQSFVSAQGKEIFVAKEVAVKNDVRTKQGKALHKVLERQVKAEELQVEVSSEEEQWALRLINILNSLDGLLLQGYTRELPVFGVLQGEVVVGVIDEVVLKTDTPITSQKRPFSSPTRSKSKKLRRSLSPSQHLVTEYFQNTTPVNSLAPVDIDIPPAATETEIERPSTPEEIGPTPTSPPRKFLHLLDTKTRRTNTLPEDRATLPSRIQLMLYYRLLKDLTSLSPPFDFAAMWQRVGVNPTKTLSTRFLLEAGLLKENNSWNTSCLNDFSNAFVELVENLGISGVDTELELVYRLIQGDKIKRKKFREKGLASPAISQEERDLAKAIEASLINIRNSGEPAAQESSVEIALQSDFARNTDTPSDVGTPTVGLKSSLQNFAGNGNDVKEKSIITPRPVSSSDCSDTELESGQHDLRPIGIKLFEYDEEMLNQHIAHVLKWWRGNRNPQGVSLEDSWRCRTCEYENNCEWREEKASEVQERLLRHQ
ncbi:Defects in morphology protein 1 like protein [Termitomyces sp. T112]|nr:Defects in morphology protein 1 like protein [Termitomyces sp. T112]